MRYKLLLIVFFGTFPLSTQLASAAPQAEEYLRTGQLSEGATALQAHLKKSPADDEARFGLGVVQFFQSFEHLGGTLYDYGLRTEDAFRGLPAPIREMLAQNPNPKTISYNDMRQMLQTWVNDLKAAEKTLSAVKDSNVKLPLHVGLIKVDLLGNGTPVDAKFLLSQTGGPQQQQAAENLVVDFDRGDADWLAGYCNFPVCLGRSAAGN